MPDRKGVHRTVHQFLYFLENRSKSVRRGGQFELPRLPCLQAILRTVENRLSQRHEAERPNLSPQVVTRCPSGKARGDRGKTVGDARALTENHQLMADGDDSKAPFQMIANLDLQTLHIGLKARLDVAKLNLMLSSDCSQIGTGSSNSPRSAT
jgi:hypothetical protein